MKKLNLKFDSFKEKLSREQMKKITGGYGEDICFFWCENTTPETETMGYDIDYGPLLICEAQSYLANLECVSNVMIKGWENCHYECACDGWGRA